MKNIKQLFLIFTILISSSFSLAVDPQNFNGRFSAPGPLGTVFLDVNPNLNNLIVTFSSGEWNSKIKNRSYQFTCSQSNCFAEVPEINHRCEVSINLLESGSFLLKSLTPRFCEVNLKFAPYTGSSDRSKWQLSQTVDSSGILSVTAAVNNNSQNSSLKIQCTAPSAALKLSLKISDTLWRALSYSVNNKQENLRLILTAKRETFETNQWTLAEGNLVLREDSITAAEINALRLGTNAKIDILTVDAAGKTTRLETLNFALKGSSYALTEMQKRCTGPINTNIPAFVELATTK